MDHGFNPLQQAQKKGYKKAKQTVKLEDEEQKEIEIKLKKTTRKITKATVY